ncbi:MAG TPA: MFS transporter [Candidatus Flavonifractor merdipullorum]|uniref:MFS transporter n=1 Tax=Candidatus Flavonifractor merdipullorum TaxID=2838590 RepID=A0A9D1RUS9_9FIRM|nr:MFS transporter [Candidatus Flavonifractor merdipullorum]
MKKESAPSGSPGGTLNRAKPYQLVLFPLNNGATNVYYVLILSYVATFGSAVLGIAMVFASVMVTSMRVFDAITDPIIGALMDKTNGKFGKFRPFMVIGCVTMAVSVICLYVLTPYVPADMMWLRYVLFVLLYAVWVIGYTFQTSVTRAGQAVLTNDPKQRPLFTIFNTVGSLAGMGVMQFVGPIIARDGIAGDYNQTWFAIMTPIGIAVSVVLTILAIIGIWEKDQPKYFGLGGGSNEKVKLSEYVAIIKANKPLQRLMIAGGGCKLALSIATNVTVLIMLYGCMMGDYDNLYLPMMVLGYVFAVPFFGLTVRTAQKKGQKASLVRYVALAFCCYIGVLVLLLLWKQGDPAFNFSIMSGGKLSINLYTILFILFFGVGYGAYYATADMPIPMVADCADYETYRSGKFIPGIMGTLFSLVDKLVSSLSATVVGIAVSFIGLETLPTKVTPYTPGMNVVVIVLFCIIPMIAWAATLIAMKGYDLTGERMKKIQAVNAMRKEAIANGMSMEEAMKINNVPEQLKQAD